MNTSHRPRLLVRRALFVAAMAAAAAVPAAFGQPASAPDSTILQNRLLRLEFSTTDGSLTQITDRKTGREWLSASAPHRLVKLIQRTPEKSSNILLSNEAGAPKITRAGDTLTLQFPALRDGKLDTGVHLTVTVRLPEASSEALFTLEVENTGNYPVVEAWFPFIASRRAADGRKDVFTTSHGAVRDLYARFDHGAFDTHAFGEHLQRIGLSSGQLLPMMDLSTPESGLSYIKYERRPRPTDFVYENLSGDAADVQLGWAWVTTLLLPPGATYRSCEIGIGTHHSDWHATADRLRHFMDGWWHPAAGPAELKEKIGLYHVQIKGFNGEPYHDFNELPAMAQDCQKYGIKDLLFWDYTASVYCRPDAAGDFWEMPAAREQMLKKALSEVKGMGFQVSACVNYRLINETSKAWQRIGSEAQVSFFGVPLYGNASGSMNGAIYINKYYDQGTRSLSQGTEKFRQFAFDLTRQTLDLGLNSLFIDQAYEGSYALPKAARGLDPFAVMDQAYAWFGKATEMARARDPHAYSIGEVPDLWNTQSVNAWWVWGWGSAEWPSLEVFQYLMPETCFVYCTDEYQRPRLSNAFAMGAFFAIATKGMTGLMSDAPDFAAQIGRLAKLRAKTAGFVAHGRFVDKRGLAVTGATGYVFQSGRGLAVTLANGAAQPVDVTVRLHPGALTVKTVTSGEIDLEDGSTVRATPTIEGEEWLIHLKIGAYAAAIWTLPFAK